MMSSRWKILSKAIITGLDLSRIRISRWGWATSKGVEVVHRKECRDRLPMTSKISTKIGGISSDITIGCKKKSRRCHRGKVIYASSNAIKIGCFKTIGIDNHSRIVGSSSRIINGNQVSSICGGRTPSSIVS